MKKLCFVTAARSEYGLLKWLMRDIDESDLFEFQLIVTGGHLSKEQGFTIEQIIEEGFKIDYKIDAQLDSSSTVKIAESMGRMTEGFAKAFDLLKPDYIIVLGDRYELLPVCSTALVMSIPIIHLCGGDVTEGAIDDNVRNAITMMADYHFVGTTGSANNVKRMRNTDEKIWVVGEPGLDSFNRGHILERDELARELCLDSDKRWGLMTYHAETKADLAYNLEVVDNIIHVLLERDNTQTVITYANADFGGLQINKLIEEYSNKYPDKFKVFPSLGQNRYLNYMRQVSFVIGNSSSGIVEAPYLNIPVVNVGNRQLGRYMCENIITSEGTIASLRKALDYAISARIVERSDLYYWGDGNCSKRVMQILKEELL